VINNAREGSHLFRQHFSKLRLSTCSSSYGAHGYVRKALEETHYQLPARDRQLLCIGSWLFKPTESDIWEFYQFTFHEKLETERHNLFTSIQRSWNSFTGEKLTTKQVTQWWRDMIISVFY
jgi:hypothetical protein